jgi:CelD/BcsL family acetyltransferase involved in cellulose biosynthesis
MIVRVSHGKQIVGLGLLGIRKQRLFSLRQPALHLNETGDSVQDRIMTEYNGLMTLDGWEEDAAAAFLAGLGDSKDFGLRDLHLSGVPGQWAELCRRGGLKTRLLRPVQGAPYTALQTLAAGDPLAMMTRNGRQQVRRSLRYYEQRGPLALDRAMDATQAVDWLDALEVLHTRSWRLRGKGGAFSDGSFKNFHRSLISAGFGEGVPDILRVRAGETILGYLYNLRWRGAVNAYQSGFHFEDDAHARPGLVAHVLAMRMYHGEGMSADRFLAGDARYKSSLATGRDELLWMVARRPGVMRRLAETAGGLLGTMLARKF